MNEMQFAALQGGQQPRSGLDGDPPSLKGHGLGHVVVPLNFNAGRLHVRRQDRKAR
jgi:hypothetical protein